MRVARTAGLLYSATEIGARGTLVTSDRSIINRVLLDLVGYTGKKEWSDRRIGSPRKQFGKLPCLTRLHYNRIERMDARMGIQPIGRTVLLTAAFSSSLPRSKRLVGAGGLEPASQRVKSALL